jgi:hypothetical protein
MVEVMNPITYLKVHPDQRCGFVDAEFSKDRPVMLIYKLWPRTLMARWYSTILLTLLICSGVTGTGCLHAQETTAFPIDWNDIDHSSIDLSRFLDAPAGGDGFVRPRGEIFVDDSGKRIRLWGVNLGGPACFPSHEDAERLASTLARIGVNCVRFHGLDSDWGRSSIDRRSGDTSQLNEADLERFDYLFDQLRKRGIYGNLNLNTFRTYGPGDGLARHVDLGLAKCATHFHPRLIELQEKYATDFLTHRNRYTGNRYVDEPAVFVVEIVNENSLIEGWFSGRLIGLDDGSGDTWSPLPVAYADELNRQFNEWLGEQRSVDQIARFRSEGKVADEAPLTLLTPKQFRSASDERFSTDYEFIVQTERAYLARMKTLIKDELGLKSMLIGDADHNDSINGYPHIFNNAMFEYIDGHGYWQHPQIGDITRTRNDPMVNDPGDSTIVQFARTPMVGKPFVVSETNHPYPHRYAAEGIPIMVAYAMLQDWDGVFFHEWGRGGYENQTTIRHNGWFDLSADPLKVAELMIGALIWHAGDLQAARKLIVRNLTPQQMLDNSRAEPWKHRPFFDDAFAKTLPLVHRTRWQLVTEAIESVYPNGPELGNIVSDTGQLRWQDADRRLGRIVIDTPKVQATVGFQQNPDHDRANDSGTRHLSVDVKNEFAAVVLVSLDGQPIASSRKILLLVADRAANQDLTWKDDWQTVANWGDGPVSIRGVEGKISLRGLDAGPPLKTTVLGSLGQPGDKTWTTYAKDNAWHILLGDPPALMAIIDRPDE